MRILAVGIAVALSAGVLAQGISTGEATEKVKAGKTSTKSDASKQTKGGKIGGLKMEQDVIEQTSKGLKAKGKGGTEGRGGYDFSHRLYR